jgi:hypothetical protein
MLEKKLFLLTRINIKFLAISIFIITFAHEINKQLNIIEL